MLTRAQLVQHDTKRPDIKFISDSGCWSITKKELCQFWWAISRAAFETFITQCTARQSSVQITQDNVIVWHA